MTSGGLNLVYWLLSSRHVWSHLISSLRGRNESSNYRSPYTFLVALSDLPPWAATISGSAGGRSREASYVRRVTDFVGLGWKEDRWAACLCNQLGSFKCWGMWRTGFFERIVVLTVLESLPTCLILKHNLSLMETFCNAHKAFVSGDFWIDTPPFLYQLSLHIPATVPFKILYFLIS